MTDLAWIESMQEEFLQFKRLDVWVLVPPPDHIKPHTLKWLFKNKHDEENTAKPTEKHLKEVKRIFCYLRGTVNMGLWYTKDYGFELIGFLDADYAGCKDTFKNWRDLPRNTPLDRVEVLGMIEKRSKVRTGIIPSEVELALEQSQQGVRYEVSVSIEGVEE
ncbi:hypothetical protein Tco_0445533 [Tanacetum coccineum]